MAEAKVEVAVDVSNRPYLVYRVPLDHSMIGTFDGRLAEDFLYAFAHNAGLDLHVELRYGQSPHHVVEAVFKGVARALRVAPRARSARRRAADGEGRALGRVGAGVILRTTLSFVREPSSLRVRGSPSSTTAREICAACRARSRARASRPR